LYRMHWHVVGPFIRDYPCKRGVEWQTVRTETGRILVPNEDTNIFGYWRGGVWVQTLRVLGCAVPMGPCADAECGKPSNGKFLAGYISKAAGLRGVDEFKMPVRVARHHSVMRKQTCGFCIEEVIGRRIHIPLRLIPTWCHGRLPTKWLGTFFSAAMGIDITVTYLDDTEFRKTVLAIYWSVKLTDASAPSINISKRF